MKAALFVIVTLAMASTSRAQIPHFEARIRTEAGANAVDFIQANDAATARLIAEARHPEAHIKGIYRMPSATSFAWFRARLSVDGVNLVDTAQARGSGEARRLFTARYAHGRIVSLIEMRDLDGYRLFRGTIGDVGPRTFRDVALATSVGNAGKAFRARYPDARISSIVEVR